MLLSFGVALGLAVLATYLAVSKQKAAQFSRERDLLKASWEAERAELENALKAAKRRPSSPGTASTEPVQARGSAQELLDKLRKTKVSPGEHRLQSVRLVVHYLESLAELGTEALPGIRDFLSKFEDVDYSGEAHDEDKEGHADGKDRAVALPGMPNRAAQVESILPPSLRLGLVQVLKEIGGEPAEQVLSEMLTTSGRGVEIAYVAKALQEIAPNKYRDIAIAAAKDLLANPPAIDRPNRLDDNAKNFLYGVLSMYNDQSFATVAQSLLVTQDGRVDRTALTYLTGTLNEEAVPALYQAFKDNRLTNMWERASLATQILSYTGNNQQANDIFKEVVGNETLPSWLRATAIQSVAGGRGQFFGGLAPSDPNQIKARIELLNSMPDISDERLARARTEAIQKLSDSLAATSDDAASGRSFRTRLGQGQADLPPPLPVTR